MRKDDEPKSAEHLGSVYRSVFDNMLNKYSTEKTVHSSGPFYLNRNLYDPYGIKMEQNVDCSIPIYVSPSQIFQIIPFCFLPTSYHLKLLK